MSSRGHLVLEHPIDQIADPHLYRSELGDLRKLRDSIERLGLLTPVTISIDYVLISGRRRLAVMRELGETRVPVWIAAGVSDELRTLLAIKDENTLQKNLTPTEQAALYAELKGLLAEENARKQRATRFGATAGTDITDAGDGGGESQPPHRRKSRVQAAEAVTGRDSSQQMEEILELQRLAADDEQDPRVREAAAAAVIGVDADRKVHGRYLDVKNLAAQLWLERIADDADRPQMVRQAAAAQAQTLRGIPHRAERAREAARGTTRIAALLDTPLEELSDADTGLGVRERFACERAAMLVSREPGWWAGQDPDVIGRYATDTEWDLISSHLEGAAAFLDAAHAARHAAHA
ncbi:ParB/RepB/Spo0J family partition protein [Microbacterium rhizophilus]|uniref:ParB/RepB/Spo0J family partition protein n=1 Tax=Microbacterium rhizophilus TaxID=3138934 RepID=UPI0031E55906